MWTYYSAYMEPVGSFKKDLRTSNAHLLLGVVEPGGIEPPTS